jgi:hypothetical protein
MPDVDDAPGVGAAASSAGPRPGRGAKNRKVPRYSDQELRLVLLRAAAAVGHPPTIAEFDRWREHEMKKAHAAGDQAFRLPSCTPYQARWNSWEAALAHHGVVIADQRAADEAAVIGPDVHEVDRGIPAVLSIARLRITPNHPVLLDADELERLRQEWDKLPRRNRYILTDRYELLGPRSTLEALAEELHLTDGRVHQVQSEALVRLCRAVFGPRVDEAAKARVLAALKALAAK